MPTQTPTRSTLSTNSRPVEPDELDLFADFCESVLTLDNRRPFILEPFQRRMLTELFAGTRETLILLPKKNGKTTLLAALSLYHLLTTPDADCIIVAASREQAEYTLRQARGFVRRSDSLSQRLQVKQREIVYEKLGGTIKIRASDVDTVDGWLGTLGFIDEMHRHKSSDLYGVIRDGLGARDGQMVTISTSGADQQSVLWQMRQAAIDTGTERDGAYLCAGGGPFVLHEWALSSDQDLDNIELVKTANPLSTMTVEHLRERHDSASMAPWQWARFACNIWTQGEEAWLPLGAWDLCKAEYVLPEKPPVWVGVDLGMKHDSAAIVYVWERAENQFVTWAEVIEPPTDGTSLDVAELEHRLRKAAHRYDVQAVAYDPWRFERSAQLLGDEGLLMIEHPMSNVRMAPESEKLREGILAHRLIHDGDSIYASHVNAGVPTETERGWRLTKRKAKDRIDALIALVIAYDLALTKPTGPKRRVAMVSL